MARSNGYQTKNRQMILDYLKENQNKTVSVADIFSYMGQSENSVNMTTVYRYLDKLVSEGILLKYASNSGEKSSYHYIEPEHDCHEHLHMKCVKCGKVIHLDCDFMKEITQHVSQQHAFTIQCDHSILYGVCEECKEK